MDATITLTVNGKKRTVTTDPERPLLDVLREDLHLTGTKYCCGEGLCGACAVLMAGDLILSCITPISEVHQKEITTIEGLAKEGKLHPIQQAVHDNNATQCGYCLPGVIMAAKALLDEKPSPTEQEVKEALGGHICRCGTFNPFIDAVMIAAGGR